MPRVGGRVRRAKKTVMAMPIMKGKLLALFLAASGKRKEGEQSRDPPAAMMARNAVVHGTTAKPESISMGYSEVRRQASEPELLLLGGRTLSLCF